MGSASLGPGMVASSSDFDGGDRIQLGASGKTGVSLSTSSIKDFKMFEVGNGQTAKQVPGIGINNPVSHSSDRPKSFSEAVGRTSVINDKVRFEFASTGNNDVSKSGKTPSASLSPFAIVPNPEMLDEIVKEKNRLRDTAIFFSVVEIDKCRV